MLCMTGPMVDDGCSNLLVLDGDTCPVDVLTHRTDGVIIMSLVTLVLDDSLVDPPAALAVSAMASARRDSGGGGLGAGGSSGGGGGSMRLGTDTSSSLPSQVGPYF
jgi:hypothetical protein